MLRDRIAATLKAQAEFRGIYKIADFDFQFLADAVIAELNLTQERDVSQWRNEAGELIVIHRYVTNWKADDE